MLKAQDSVDLGLVGSQFIVGEIGWSIFGTAGNMRFARLLQFENQGISRRNEEIFDKKRSILKQFLTKR